MADNYIDNQETLSYGDFAAAQIPALVLGLDAELDLALQTAVQRLTVATEAMRAALKKADGREVLTHKPADGAQDPITEARSVLRRLVNYAASRDNGDILVEDILARATLGTVLKRHPAKLASALNHALNTLTQHQGELPEHAKWTQDLSAAKAALDALNTTVRQSRAEPRESTPEVTAARAAWFKAYGAAKLIVEAVLRYQDKLALLEEVFDDLAEIHRAPGVRADAPTPEPPHPPRENEVPPVRTKVRSDDPNIH